ncbi:ABC transporter ATP-binding protein [Clostridium sp.]|uniref:ABC transporter ATP-binding protein n=1 Tax=Clostridium sp. TaxID=1506 RepID=UPI003FA549A6
MLNITKTFPGIIANDNVTLQLKKGEIHALLGENGAGKSTLMSVLFGMYSQDSGVIKIKGKEVVIKNPNDANSLSIGMVHQHFKLVNNFTVLENIVLGMESTKGMVLKMDDARKKVLNLSEKYNLKIEPDKKISEITVGMQQRVEILKMLYRDNEILIFDEPTAVLTPQEIEEFMKILKNLTREGKSIIFITHKLKEIKAVADRCSVLRKGKYIGTIIVEKTTKEEMSEMMVGRKVNLKANKIDKTPGKIILKVNNISLKGHGTTKNKLNNVNFEVKQGEIVAIAGIDGNGQRELSYTLTGLQVPTSGEIFLIDENITKASIRDRSIRGISCIPEDRHKHGLILQYTLEENFILQSYYTNKFQRKGFLKFKEIESYGKHLIEKYDIRSSQGGKTLVKSMSGGNQQKAILAREIDRNPRLLIAMQPTRGLDVGAIEYIHKELIRKRDENCGVLLISLEIDEVMNIADRILVIYEGEIVGEVNPKTTTINELGLLMSGSKGGEINA